MLMQCFKLKEHGTTVRTELLAGMTTFMTMAYILAVNPSILGAAGMDVTAVFLATCLASVIGCTCMAFMANMPLALSAGMGLNAFFAYTVVLGMGYPWQIALLAVFVEGLVFILLSLMNVREAIFNAIPYELKQAVSVGIGLFIAFIGLQKAGVCVDNPATLVGILRFSGEIANKEICALLALLGTLVTAVLYIRNVRGAILIGIFFTWFAGMFCQMTGMYVPDPASGFFSLLPQASFTDFSRIGLTFGQCFHFDISGFSFINFCVVVLSFLFVDFFDTLGTVIGVSARAGMLDEQGRLPQIRSVLMADAVATTFGAVFGTSTTTTYVESSTGVATGGRTGLTALTVAFFFLLSMLFAPVFTAIPPFATAPALIFVGFLMFSNVAQISFASEHYASAIPAYLCILAMPLFYSISEGIALGVIFFVLINHLCGRSRKITPIMYALALLFLLKYMLF